MAKKLIINADDLGFSLGVNQAILRANTEGFLTHASLMANTKYFINAVEEIIPKSKNLKVGVHVNLTCGKALSSNNILAKNGLIQSTFVKLLFLPKTEKNLQSLENEIEAQIVKIKETGISISHIDGHEHVHIIPSINKIVRKLAKKYDIPRIREINENLFESLKFNAKTASFSNVIKLLLLKTLSLFNKNENKVGFYCMLNTCEINGENLFHYLSKSNSYDEVEIMLHPCIQGIDDEKYLKTLDPRFITFFEDEFRKKELELCFNPNFENYERSF